MPSPNVCTAYRWPGQGSTHWLLILPNGESFSGWCLTEAGANGVIGALSRAKGCPLTVIAPKHPNEAEVARA